MRKAAAAAAAILPWLALIWYLEFQITPPPPPNPTLLPCVFAPPFKHSALRGLALASRVLWKRQAACIHVTSG
jgi:hypothetical protein